MLEFLEKHPEAIGIAIAAVAALAYFSGGSSSSGTTDDGDITFTGGGVRANPMDPNQAAIDEARIAAGSANIGTLAALILGSKESDNALTAHMGDVSAAVQSSHDSLSASLAATAAGERVQTASIAGQLQAALASISAQRDTSLAQTQAGIDIAHEQYSTAAAIAGQYSQDQLAAAKYTADASVQIAKYNSDADYAAQQAAIAANNANNATAKSIASGQQKTDIWTSVISGVGNIVGAIFGSGKGGINLSFPGAVIDPNYASNPYGFNR